MRIGTGYDVHRLAPGRKLILGGVEIPFPLGLDGHSDADVLVHAIMDALLGAAALGDIGKHFPDTAEEYRGISSLALLERVGEIIDSTIIAQQPKLRPYIDSMRENIAQALEVDLARVSVKATTEEGLGFTGSGEGMAAQAVCLIASPSDLMTRNATFDNGAPVSGGSSCERCPMRNAASSGTDAGIQQGKDEMQE